MASADNCRWQRIGGDYWEVCPPKHADLKDKSLEELMEIEIENSMEGTYWGAFICGVRSIGYTDSCVYDWYADICTCKGDYRPMMWRR